MGIDWDKPLRVKGSDGVISDMARWGNGAPAINPEYQTVLCVLDNGGNPSYDYLHRDRIENVPETYWIAIDDGYAARATVSMRQLVHEGWSPDATCIELEPVTNGPDRVVQTILLGDAE